MMTLESAIKHCEEVVEEQEKLCKVNDPFNFSQSKWKECAKEYSQLTEWLKELKRLREQAVNVIPILDGATNGDMIKAIFGVNDNDIDEGLSTTYLYTGIRILKGGSQDLLRKQITFSRDWWNAPYKMEGEE